MKMPALTVAAIFLVFGQPVEKVLKPGMVLTMEPQ
jgi:hypothetical protein